MDRPPSIKLFERLWWGSTILWGIGRRLSWERVQNGLSARLAASAQRDPNVAAVQANAQWALIAIVLLVTVLLWWLVARRGSLVGKWLVIAAAAWSAVQVLILAFQLVGGANLHPLSQGAFLLASALTIWSAAVLFRDDARSWFGERPDEADDEELPA